MADIIDKVVTFNMQVLGIEQRMPGAMSTAEHEITVKCLHEEVEEYVEAYDNCMRDDNAIKSEFEVDYVVDMADALIDNVYFAIGALYKLGLTADQIREMFNVVHNCNVAKKAGTNAKRDTGAADAVKPEGWEPPEKRLKSIVMERVK